MGQLVGRWMELILLGGMAADLLIGRNVAGSKKEWEASTEMYRMSWL